MKSILKKLYNLKLNKKKTLLQLKLKPYILNKGHSDSVNLLVINPNGKYIVSVSENKTIKVWDLNSNKNIYTIDSNFELAIDE